MLYSGGADVQSLIREFEKQLESATSTFVALKDSFEKNDEPLSGFVDSHRHCHQSDGKQTVSFPPSRWRDEQIRRGDDKFLGRHNRGGRYGRPLKHSFAAKPLNDRGNWRQDHYKRDSAHNIHEARNSLRQLKQAAGGAGDVQHFPMAHFDSATPVENGIVKHDTVDIMASDTSDNDMPFKKQFADSEPPFEASFMDKMSVTLNLNDNSEVSMHSFVPNDSLISSTNDFSVDVIDLESDSESDIEDEDGRMTVRYNVPPPAPRVGDGFRFTNTVPYNTPDFALDHNFSQASGFQDSDYINISNLDFAIENNNNFCELCTVDHFQGG
ncbi:hypothetical protein CYMTET_46164 [Cymbomonas tetramitiformis]|nr:hypothetical protein CYMTET_46164 [Cymbomonas tetramitiformis]